MFGHTYFDTLRIEVEPETVRLLVCLVDALDPLYVVETGCYHGTTSVAIGHALRRGHLDTMDIDEVSMATAGELCKGLPVTVHHCSSFDFIPIMAVDLAFLDSGIGDTRLREMEHFRPFMAVDGLVAIHDAVDLWDPWPELAGWRWVRLGTPRGLLLAQAV